MTTVYNEDYCVLSYFFRFYIDKSLFSADYDADGEDGHGLCFWHKNCGLSNESYRESNSMVYELQGTRLSYTGYGRDEDSISG